MENLETGAVCLARFADSRQLRCGWSLLRLATFVILFLCSISLFHDHLMGTRNNDR